VAIAPLRLYTLKSIARQHAAAASHPASTLFFHRSSWWDKNKAAAAILADKVKRSVGTLGTTWLIVIDRCSADKYFAFS
jgi:hypothetical protein